LRRNEQRTARDEAREQETAMHEQRTRAGAHPWKKLGQWGAIATLGWAAFAAPAMAADGFPAKPIRLVVGFAPGSGNDAMARLLAKGMGEKLGQPVVVDNKPGAGGQIGTEVVAKAPPDGYTIGLGTSSQLVMNVAVFDKLPFDVDADLRPIGLVSKSPLVLVSSKSAPATLADLIRLAKAKPGEYTYGSAGPGSISHIVAEAFAHAAGIRLRHVPYKGNLAAGHIDLVFDGVQNSVGLTEKVGGHVLAYAGDERQAQLPQVPTFAQAGLKGFQAYTWNNLFTGAKVPDAVVDKLNAALNAALAGPEVRRRLDESGADSLGPSTPAQAQRFERQERQHWVPLIKALGVRVN
jgi:tripartite-type tricarboxylate transporter receptor subunit TctC